MLEALSPPHYTAKFSPEEIATGAFNTDLSDYIGKKARSILLSPQFGKKIWNENLDPGAGKSKNEWGLTKFQKRGETSTASTQIAQSLYIRRDHQVGATLCFTDKKEVTR